MNDLAPVIIPLFGALWIFMLVMVWGVPAIRNFKSQRKMLEQQADQLHKLNMQMPHLIDFVHQIRSKVESLEDHLQMQLSRLNHDVMAQRHEAKDRAEAIARPMPGSASFADFDGIRSAFNGRIESIEKKLDDMAKPPVPMPVPEEEVVEESADPSEPVPFEVYREALLRLWDGEVSIEEHCNEWRGRLVLPRPGRKARA